MNSGGAIEIALRIARTYEPVDKIAAVNVKGVDLTVLLQMATPRIIIIIMEKLVKCKETQSIY
jgi:hypothetical protein